MLFAWIIPAVAQQPVSFSVQADADDWQLYMSSRLMQDFNSGNKIVFITLTAGDEGNGANTFNGSALPYYVARERGAVYSVKTASDISLSNNGTVDSVPALQTAVIHGHTKTS
jgi:hypothetical protein